MIRKSFLLLLSCQDLKSYWCFSHFTDKWFNCSLPWGEVLLSIQSEGDPRKMVPTPVWPSDLKVCWEMIFLSNLQPQLAASRTRFALVLFCKALLCAEIPIPLCNRSQLFKSYLAIIPWASMGSESIAHEAKGQMGYWLRGHEGERNNNLLVKFN